MAKISLIASLTTFPSSSGAEIANLGDSVEALEVSADLLGDLDPEWLRTHFKGKLIYALPSTSAGGGFGESLTQRHLRLAAAANKYDLVEIEADYDFADSLLAQIPIARRVVSWHGRATDLTSLNDRFAQLSRVPARFYKLVIEAHTISEEILALFFLRSLGRSDTIAYSKGPLGFWTRLVALHLGAPAIFGLLSDDPAVPAEPTVSRLIQDYGLPTLMPIKQLFAIIGSPVFHSLSPRLHNAAYRALGYPALFVPLHVTSFGEFWQAMVQSKLLESLGLPLNGMTVASPHKEAALIAAKLVSPMASRAESANVLLRNNGWWSADTTDPEVIDMARRNLSIRVREKKAAVIGCGGAGRAIAAALIQSGAGVTLINRGARRGHHAAQLLGLPYLPLSSFDAEGYDIVVNATPVGRDNDDVPFKLDQLEDEAVVIDLAYGSRPTPLVDGILARDQVIIDGRDVLLTQVLRQFHMMTQREMPISIASEALGRRAAAAGVSDPMQVLV
jgi:3-dehydroquinate dehydratase/shikimate dehydrogenase